MNVPQSSNENFALIVRNYLKELGIFTDNVEKILVNITENKYLPKNRIQALSDSARTLTTKEKKYDFSPFSKRQQKSFRLSKKWERLTAIGLHPIVAGIIFIICLLFIFVGFISLSPATAATVTSISISASFISSLALAYAGLVLTGTNPDMASRRANDAQNHARALTTSYRYMSQRLLELYAHHETQSLAEDIAFFFNKYNRKLLKNRMLKLLGEADVGELLRSLKEVHMFIREGSRNTALLNPDLTTHWLTLESNSLMNPPRVCDLKALFHVNPDSSQSDSQTNSYTSFDFQDVIDEEELQL